ncbi:RNA exonuclease 1-like protein [Trichoplax sp. H2]|nr:RNA exonuclease 1-like protein [Trichoplax sp. H2]|eukprot:RDD42792.1 RNA exonuclease 1-like protein [Trichoplax sp. H2]
MDKYDKDRDFMRSSTESKSTKDDLAEYYEGLKNYIANIDNLRRNAYPLPVPGKTGATSIPSVQQKYPAPVIQRNGVFILRFKYFGGWNGYFNERAYSCCDRPVGRTGCTTYKNHVFRYYGDMSSGYVTTASSITAGIGVYALDCEMCYTSNGMELCRITLIDHNIKIICDTLVKPSGRVIDYNTRFSGVTESDMEGINVTLRDVQATLLSYINGDTILVGHGLENDLLVLKLIHEKIVDTALVFPHRRGLPYKRSLKNLARDHLGRTIQSSDKIGHDSIEDAATCIDLMKWKIKNDEWKKQLTLLKNLYFRKPINEML